MALIRIRETGELLTEITFRTRHKKTRPVVTSPISVERLDELGADPVLEGPAATVTAPYEFSYRSGVEQNDAGQWFTVYSVGPNFSEYTDEDGVTHTVADQMAAYRANVDEKAADRQRLRRNELLDESDWTQINDSPLNAATKTAWATYRQDLRNLSDHTNWPHLEENDWPIKP